MQLTEQQQKLHDYMLEWVHNPTSPYIALAGYAGTGKTTLMGTLALSIKTKFPNKLVAFLAPTGKASLVLDSKLKQFGVNGLTGTIHSFIYTLVGKDGRTLLWSKKSPDADLIMVDEASMISESIFKDLLSLGIPLIFVGDSGQLPPVGSKAFQPLLDTALVLTEVHRQALGNPIIKLATDTRMGIRIPFGNYSNVAAKVRNGIPQAVKILNSFVSQADKEDCILLCHKNKTRAKLNTKCRGSLGYSGIIPNSGEKLVCLKNDKLTGFRNGQLLTVEKSSVVSDIIFKTSFIGEPLHLYAYTKALGITDNNKIFSSLNEDAREIKEYLEDSPIQTDLLLLDYGYTLSVHKSQGSEWKRVVLFDEGSTSMTEAEYFQWLYTGITRAKEKLLIIA